MNHTRLGNTPIAFTPARGSRVRRALAVLAGLGALTAAAPALAVPHSRVSMFTVDGKGVPGKLLTELELANTESHGLRSDELKPDLLDTPLDQVLVLFDSDNWRRNELALFTLDPSLHALLMRNVAAFAVVGADPNGLGWIDVTRTPTDGSNVNLPYSVTVPYPNDGILFLPPPGTPPLSASVTLGVTKFAGNPPNQLVGPAAAPGARGSVKGLRLYDHGACSREVALAPIYEAIQEQAWERYRDAVNDQGGDAERFYMALMTILDRKSGAPTNELHDGFQLGGHLYAHNPTFVPDAEATAYMEVELMVKDGHVRAEYVGDPLIDAVVFGPVSDDIFGDIVKSSLEEIRVGVGQSADALQTIDVLGDNPLFDKAKQCDPEKVNPCQAAAEMLGFVIEDGAKPAGQQYGVELDVNQLTSLVKKPEAWSCVAEKDGGKAECRFFVPAKRLNVYPDDLELVWFDGVEMDNPAFAIWVATQAPYAPAGSADMLCGFSQDSNVIFSQREYASSFWGSAYAAAP